MIAGQIRETLLYRKAFGCLYGSIIGDAMGTPTEGRDYTKIAATFGWVDDFKGEGTDDTVMRDLLAEALIETDGYATLDDWARVWLAHWDAIFGPKVGKFFISVLHTAHKLRHHSVPRMAALGNMPSSSSAMCISPVGIVNACNPRRAARQAYDLGSLIHQYDVGFCQDGAAAMAAAVAEAMKPDATITTVLAAAQEAILPLSGQEMLDAIGRAMRVAQDCGEYHAFVAAIYGERERYFHPLICDARETIPLTLALLYLGGGNLAQSVTYAANFGRDADTIGAMCGAICGALGGIAPVRADWVAQIDANAVTDQHALAEKLCLVALQKNEQERQARVRFEQLVR